MGNLINQISRNLCSGGAQLGGDGLLLQIATCPPGCTAVPYLLGAERWLWLPAVELRASTEDFRHGQPLTN